MFGMIRAYARSLSVNQDVLKRNASLSDDKCDNEFDKSQNINLENYYDDFKTQDVMEKERVSTREVYGKSKSFRGNKELGYESKRLSPLKKCFLKIKSLLFKNWGKKKSFGDTYKSKLAVRGDKQPQNCLKRKNVVGLVAVSLSLFLGLVLSLMFTSPSRANTEDLNGINLALADTQSTYYTVYDYADKEKVVFVKGDGVNVGDEYLSADNKLYEIVSVDNKAKVGYAEFVCKEELPKFNVRRATLNESQALAETSKKVGVYHTHNDESYLDKDGTDSVYGKGGIHDVGASFVKNLKSLGINVIYREDLHLPHNSGAYTRSQVTASAILDTGNIDALFDVHRDSTPRSEYVTEVGGTPMTKVRMVVGSANANYYENKEFAYAIKAYADEVFPNFIKDIYMGKGNYNQQLLSRGMLFEMGCEKIEKEYAIRSTEPLAKVLDVVLYGSEAASEESTKGLEFVDSNGQKSVISGIVSKKSTASVSFIWILLSGIAFYFVILGIVCIFSKTARYKTGRFFKELFLIKR